MVRLDVTTCRSSGPTTLTLLEPDDENQAGNGNEDTTGVDESAVCVEPRRGSECRRLVEARNLLTIGQRERR